MGSYAGFSKVKLTSPKKSTFDLSHDKRITTRMGRLTPCFITECVPSDSFNGSSEMLVRLAPLLAPIYDQIWVYVHFYFIPHRILWGDWEKFITGGRLGVGSTDPVTAPIPPYFDLGTALTNWPEAFQASSLADYLGVPLLPQSPDVAADYDGVHLDAMPFVAYYMCWYEYYRDRNFVNDNAMDFPVASGENFGGNPLLFLQTRCYEHDYFTSALPFTQRGPEILIPVDAAVTYLQTTRVVDAGTGNPFTADTDLTVDQDSDANVRPTVGTEPGSKARIENISDISNVTSTINDFRSAYALQVWLERNAVGGSRYTESTQAHFDVKPQDSRLQRPEYIGGGRIPVKISESISSANSVNADDDVIPQANMAGHGITYGNTNQFRYFCTEHGFIIGILSIMNPPSYHQGMPRMFRRRTFLDYPWPTFARLGEQQVDAAELFASAFNLKPDPDDGLLPLFGYQSRYADWKYICNTNHGQFHDSLLFWTLTREFSSPGAVLSNAFVMFDYTTQNRIFAVNDTSDNFWIYCHNRVFVKRPLPYFGTPNTLGFV